MEISFMNLESLMEIRDGIKNGDIPEWLLIEVLIRLPAKYVCMFKLVSKHWLSIMSDPAFVHAYISRASLSPQPWTFISSYMGHGDSHLLQEHVLSDNPSYLILPPPPSYGGKEEYMIFGVSNGLVLYGLDNRALCSLYICNPVTGQWITLPSLTRCRPDPPHHLLGYFALGWGFITHVEDGNFLQSYRVVRIAKLTHEERNFMRFDVFFSEIGEWNNFNVSIELNYYTHLSMEYTVLNGILHWIASEHGIIAYDPYQSPDRFRIIAFPSDTVHHRRAAYDCVCDVYQGKLRYFHVCDKYNSRDNFLYAKIWVLDDYSSGDWCLLHNICKADLQTNFSVFHLRPISFHPYDPDVMYLQYRDLLVSDNIKNKKVHVQPMFSDGKKGHHQLWRGFLLVLPPWPISIPSSFSQAAKV